MAILVIDQHDIKTKILLLTTTTSTRRDLVIHLLLTSPSTRWNSRATGATELSSNNLRRPRTLMGFHIQRLGDNPFRACDEILMQGCVVLYMYFQVSYDDDKFQISLDAKNYKWDFLREKKCVCWPISFQSWGAWCQSWGFNHCHNCKTGGQIKNQTLRFSHNTHLLHSIYISISLKSRSSQTIA